MKKVNAADCGERQGVRPVRVRVFSSRDSETGKFGTGARVSHGCSDHWATFRLRERIVVKTPREARRRRWNDSWDP